VHVRSALVLVGLVRERGQLPDARLPVHSRRVQARLRGRARVPPTAPSP